MENGPFIDDFPIKTTIHRGFSMAMLNNQMVNTFLKASNRLKGLVRLKCYSTSLQARKRRHRSPIGANLQPPKRIQ